MSSIEIKKLITLLEDIQKRPEAQLISPQEIDSIIAGLQKVSSIIKNKNILSEAGWKQKLGSLAVAGGLALGALGGSGDASAQDMGHRLDKARAATSQQDNVNDVKSKLMAQLVMCETAFLLTLEVYRNQEPKNYDKMIDLLKPSMNTLAQVKSRLLETQAEKTRWNNMQQNFFTMIRGGAFGQSQLEQAVMSCMISLKNMK